MPCRVTLVSHIGECHSAASMQDPVQKDPVELRASLIRRFPIVPTHKVDEILAAHGSDEDTCIAHLLAAAYNEGGCSADGQVSTSSTYPHLHPYHGRAAQCQCRNQVWLLSHAATLSCAPRCACFERLPRFTPFACNQMSPCGFLALSEPIFADCSDALSQHSCLLFNRHRESSLHDAVDMCTSSKRSCSQG